MKLSLCRRNKVALKSMADHLAELDKSPAATPNAEVTRPVYDDAYRDVIMICWKSLYMWYNFIHIRGSTVHLVNDPIRLQEAADEARCMEEELQAGDEPERATVPPLLSPHAWPKVSVPLWRVSKCNSTSHIHALQISSFKYFASISQLLYAHSWAIAVEKITFKITGSYSHHKIYKFSVSWYEKPWCVPLNYAYPKIFRGHT